MFAHRPFGIQIQFATIEVQRVALVQGRVVEEQRADGYGSHGLDLERYMLDSSVAVKRSCVITSYFALEPGAVSTADTVEHRIPVFRVTAIAISQVRCPWQIGKGVAGFG